MTLTLPTQLHEIGYRSTELLLQIPEKILLNLIKGHELSEIFKKIRENEIEIAESYRKKR